MRWGVFVFPRCKNVVDAGFAHIYQHVCVGKSLHSPNLIALHGRRDSIERLATIVLFENLAVSYRCYPVIIKLQPACLAIWLDESKVVSAVQIPRVHKNTVQLVDPSL